MDKKDASNRWYDYTRGTGIACGPVLRKNRGLTLSHLGKTVEEVNTLIFLSTIIGGNTLALIGLNKLKKVLESDIAEKKGVSA